MLVNGLVPAAGAAAAMLPLPLPLRAVGAYAGAVAGAAGRRALVPARDEAAKFDLASLLEARPCRRRL